VWKTRSHVRRRARAPNSNFPVAIGVACGNNRSVQLILNTANGDVLAGLRDSPREVPVVTFPLIPAQSVVIELVNCSLCSSNHEVHSCTINDRSVSDPFDVLDDTALFGRNGGPFTFTPLFQTDTEGSCSYCIFQFDGSCRTFLISCPRFRRTCRSFPPSTVRQRKFA
jgi:hypothetical protein